jgi:hypothetical protein
VQDAEAYQRLPDIAAQADAAEGIRQGLEDVSQGRTRPARDMESIHAFVGAESSDAAAACFIELAEAVQSLERYPERGAIVPEKRKLRRLVFGKKSSVYRIF